MKRRSNCAKCDSSFIQKGHLNIHIRTVHEENKSSIAKVLMHKLQINKSLHQWTCEIINSKNISKYLDFFYEKSFHNYSNNYLLTESLCCLIDKVIQRLLKVTTPIEYKKYIVSRNVK